MCGALKNFKTGIAVSSLTEAFLVAQFTRADSGAHVGLFGVFDGERSSRIERLCFRSRASKICTKHA